MTREFRIHRLEDRDVQASLALEVVIEHPLVAIRGRGNGVDAGPRQSAG
jgi:hypothetical protein